MENLVFERDYTKNCEQTPDNERLPDIIQQVVSGGFLKRFTASMNVVPKVVVPEYKANYEYVLHICNELAKNWDGSVRGVVDYKHWEASITLIIPYAEFISPEDLQPLRDIAERSHGVSIRPVDGSIHIHIYNRYFENLISEEEKDCIAYDCIMKDKKLANMLGLTTELSPELQKFVNYMNSVLDTLEETTGKNRTVIFKMFLIRVNRTIEEGDNIIDVMEQVAKDMIDENRIQ